ncbi:hypothetical protein ACRW6W_01510 [Escherichia coli]|nr:hypothetical protein [Escherichia coli]
MKNTIITLTLLLSFFTGSVLAGASKFIETPAPPVPDNIEITFIGNSLTRHAPDSDIGWNGDYGMAATRMSRDYAHMTANKLHLPYKSIYVRNVYPFETDGIAAQRITDSLSMAFSRSSHIVIQLSENVDEAVPEKMTTFAKTYPNLIDAIPKGKPFYCISSYWHSAAKDKIIKDACNRPDGHYVYIGDVQYMQNLNMPKKQFKNPGINKHPHDYAMNIIANRLVRSIKMHEQVNFK